MFARRLNARFVEKPWGREKLGFGFSVPWGTRIGELWFEGRSDLPLLVKYLFTSEKLSIQVHPSDAAAHSARLPRGKDEAWIVLDAQPTATLGLGLTRAMTREQLEQAARNGALERLVDWRPVKAGDFVYLPAGTVHAIGAGVTLVEIQQNADVTYRLYDYGRPRKLHLAQGIPAACAAPFTAPPMPGIVEQGRQILCEGGKFVIERWSWRGERRVRALGVPGWLVVVAGRARLDGQVAGAGECWLIEGDGAIEPDVGADLLFAYPLQAYAPLFR